MSRLLFRLLPSHKSSPWSIWCIHPLWQLYLLSQIWSFSHWWLIKFTGMLVCKLLAKNPQSSILLAICSKFTDSELHCRKTHFMLPFLEHCLVPGNVWRQGKPTTYADKSLAHCLSRFWPVPATHLLDRFKGLTGQLAFSGTLPNTVCITMLDTEIVYFYKHEHFHANWPKFLDMFNLLVELQCSSGMVWRSDSGICPWDRKDLLEKATPPWWKKGIQIDCASINFLPMLPSLQGWTPLQLNAKHSRVKREESDWG